MDKKIIYIATFVVILVVILGIFAMNNQKNDPNTNSQVRITEQENIANTRSSEPKLEDKIKLKINDQLELKTLKIKALEFKEIEKIEKDYPKEIIAPKNGAKFVGVKINLINLKKEAVNQSNEIVRNIIIKDQDNNQYSYNSEASIYAFNNNLSLMNTYPPLLEVEGWIVYEVPKTSVQFHYEFENIDKNIKYRYNLN